MKTDIPAALRDLSHMADRIAELIEWRRLDRQERRQPFLTSFDLDHHIDQEMCDLQICFADADFSLREVLKRTDLGASKEERRQWLRELERLESRVHLSPPPAGL